LSACTQTVMAAEVGELDLAYDYLGEAALIDLDDLQHNTRDGVHIASLAGTWIALICGFAGLRHRDGTVALAPRLPDGLARLTFSIFIRGRRLRVDIKHPSARYLLADGEPLEIVHHGEKLKLTAGQPKDRAIPALTARPRASQPYGRAPAKRRGTRGRADAASAAHDPA
jgi:alpha,alpha-trehalose phosphorylase